MNATHQQLFRDLIQDGLRANRINLSVLVALPPQGTVGPKASLDARLVDDSEATICNVIDLLAKDAIYTMIAQNEANFSKSIVPWLERGDGKITAMYLPCTAATPIAC